VEVINFSVMATGHHGQLMDFDPDASIPLPFKQILQSIIIASATFGHREESPILAFASGLLSVVVDIDFDRFIVDV
jgi:hypothetical protein